MTRDQVLNFAKDAGLVDPSPYIAPWPNQLDAWERFAALVAAAEREACAKACDERAEAWQAAHLAGQRAMRERVISICSSTALTVADSEWGKGYDRGTKDVGTVVRIMEVKP